jgi:hypothetical protein
LPYAAVFYEAFGHWSWSIALPEKSAEYPGLIDFQRDKNLLSISRCMTKAALLVKQKAACRS